VGEGEDEGEGGEGGIDNRLKKLGGISNPEELDAESQQPEEEAL